MRTSYYDGDTKSEAAAQLMMATDERVAVTTGLLAGEPVFVLRAKDATTLAVLNLYRVMTEGLFDDERAFTLEVDIQAAIEWRFKNQDKLRDPD